MLLTWKEENILRAMKLQLSRYLQERISSFLTSESWKGNERSHVPSWLREESSRIACLIVEAVASLIGLLLLVLWWFGSSHFLFFPEHQAHRIRVPDPSSWEIEDNLLEVTSKGRSCQPRLPVFQFWYATSCLERGGTGRAFLMGLGPEKSQ